MPNRQHQGDTHNTSGERATADDKTTERRIWLLALSVTIMVLLVSAWLGCYIATAGARNDTLDVLRIEAGWLAAIAILVVGCLYLDSRSERRFRAGVAMGTGGLVLGELAE